MNNNNATNQIQAHALTDKGRRPNNEDFVTFFEPTDLQERQNSGCIYIVADGVGGASVGERASQYAAEKVLYEYLQHPQIEPGKRLKQVITRVNREIFGYAENKGIRMATTMTVAVVLGNSLYAANVGDSRIYLIRGNEVRQITQDHNIVGEMVRDGVMTEAEALRSKAKNRLTRSLGGEDEVHVDIFGPFPLQPNDKIMLCSDGLTRYALKKDIEDLTASGSPQQITERLVNFAKERGRGGADNISVITVAYKPSTAMEATIQHPRPMVPEQPWEMLETIHDFQKQPSHSRTWKWVALSSLAMGLIAVLVVVGLYLRSRPPASQVASTLTSTLTQAPDPTPSYTSAPTATQTQDNVQSAGVDGQPTNTNEPAPTGIVDYCPNINVRPYPSSDNELYPPLGKLDCNSTVTLRGRFIDQNNNDVWYQIDYDDPYKKVNLAWVFAKSVKVAPEDIGKLQPLDFFGVPAKSKLEKVIFINCIYTIQEGDTLSEIEKKFGVAGDNTRIITCAPVSTECDISNRSHIEADWQVIVPGVTAEICSYQGGEEYSE